MANLANQTAPTQEAQGPLLFQRSDIRTMKKDIKMLRDADASSENQKITGPTIASKPYTPPTVIMPTSPAPKPVKVPIASDEPQTPVRKIQEEVVSQRSKQDAVAINQAKQYATEQEKQQIFMFESQIADIKNQIKAIGGQQGPELILEKNQILLKQEQQKKILESLVFEEKKLESQIQILETREEETNVPAEKQRSEQQRGAKENERQTSEKKRWAVEQELTNLQNQLKNLDANYEKSDQEERALHNKIAQLDIKLREIYFSIIEREKNKGVATRPAQPVAPLSQNPKNEVKPESPLDAGRRKFMEDVEAWILNNKNQQSNT